MCNLFHRLYRYCPSGYPHWNSNIVAEIAFCLEKFEEYRFLTNHSQVTVSVYRDLSLQVPVNSRTCLSRSDTWFAKKATPKERLTDELETTEQGFWVVCMAATKRTCCMSLCDILLSAWMRILICMQLALSRDTSLLVGPAHRTRVIRLDTERNCGVSERTRFLVTPSFVFIHCNATYCRYSD